MDELHVTYQRFGGIAGITMASEAGEPDLPDNVVLIAAGLLGGSSEIGTRSAGPEEEAAGGPFPAPGPDQFTYTLEVSRGRERQTFHWSDATMPEEVRPLLDTLARRSEPI